jgi:ketosteroid isomerase-like protein
MSEENKALAQRSWEIVNQRDPDTIQEFYADDLVWHEPDQDIHGSEEAKRFLALYFRAFPNLTHTVEDVIAEGDKVVTGTLRLDRRPEQAGSSLLGYSHALLV